MIKSLYVDNFKALNDFRIDFQSVSLLIGANSVGKSTVLQVLELLAYFVKGKEKGELNNYLKERNWSAKDFKSNFNSRKQTVFILTIEIEGESYDWTVHLEAKKEGFALTREFISGTDGKEYLFRTHKKSFAIGTNNEKLPLIDVSFVSSGLSLLDVKIHKNGYPELIAIKQKLQGLQLFDFSATNNLKSDSYLEKGVKIGSSGENFAAYLHSLSKTELANLSEEIQEYVPFFKNIRIIKKGNDKVEIDIEETYGKRRIDAPHLSDGMMRLLAILTLAITNSGYEILLIEEIEDGINPNVAGEIIKTLLATSKNTNKQFILTTHNPLILDWMPVENIHYLYRKEDGSTGQKTFKDSPTVLRNLDYMNPGEIWINFDEKEILEEDTHQETSQEI
ncbi:MAG: putative ATPase [Saprospiraceae bacterium]|jgi:predicted ATPase